MSNEKTGWAKVFDAGLQVARRALGEPEPVASIQSRLYEASARGDAPGVREAISGGADVNQKGPDGLYPLHLAMKARSERATDALLEAGAKVAVKDKRKMTPLHMAAIHDFKYGAERLMAKGANVDAFSDNCLTPLHCAAVMGSPMVARALLDKGAWLDALDFDGLSPLHHAANTTRQGNHLDVARLLADRGARLAANGVVDGALDHAKRKGKPEVRDFLEAAELAKKESRELGDLLAKPARPAQRARSLSL